MQYLYQRSRVGTSASCQGSAAADVWERLVVANRHQGLHRAVQYFNAEVVYIDTLFFLIAPLPGNA